MLRKKQKKEHFLAFISLIVTASRMILLLFPHKSDALTKAFNVIVNLIFNVIVTFSLK